MKKNYDNFGKQIEIMQRHKKSALQNIEDEEMDRRCKLLKRSKRMSEDKAEQMRATAMCKSLKRWIK